MPRELLHDIAGQRWLCPVYGEVVVTDAELVSIQPVGGDAGAKFILDAAIRRHVGASRVAAAGAP